MMNAMTYNPNNDVVKTTGTPRVTCASTTRVHAPGVLFVYGVKLCMSSSTSVDGRRPHRSAAGSTPAAMGIAPTVA